MGSDFLISFTLDFLWVCFGKHYLMPYMFQERVTLGYQVNASYKLNLRFRNSDTDLQTKSSIYRETDSILGTQQCQQTFLIVIVWRRGGYYHCK